MSESSVAECLIEPPRPALLQRAAAVVGRWEKDGCPDVTSDAFRDAVGHIHGSVRCRSMLRALVAYDKRAAQPFSMILPDLLKAALRYPSRPRLVELVAVQGHTVVRLSRLDCFVVLCCSLFGLHRRRTRDCMGDDGMPSINLDGMWEGAAGSTVEEEKLQMFFDYYVAMTARARRGDEGLDDVAQGPCFERRAASFKQLTDTSGFREPLRPLEMQPLGASIDDCKSALRVDFANAVPGGAAMSFGCVQEEIMFALCPEMCVCRLMMAPLCDDEALLLRRCEQFASLQPGTYAFGLRYGGPHEDVAVASSVVAAVDALDFRGARGAARAQFRQPLVHREAVKLLAGLHGYQQTHVATGNWGCGVFLGNAQLKLCVQWAVASACGLTVLYHPFDNAALADDVPSFVAELRRRAVTPEQLLAACCGDAPLDGVLATVASRVQCPQEPAP